jgi:hypothetical protein
MPPGRRCLPRWARRTWRHEPAAPAVAALNLRERYERELAARGYTADAAQSAAIEHLETLRDRLLAETAPASGGGCDSAWRRGATPVRATRGVYLWGGVGRGKTWLMDLFYDSLPLRARRRSHFHHFMRDMHEQLRQSGARREPLQLLARRIARHTRVLCLDELYVNDIVDAMLLGGLFQALLRYDVLLVITSNVPPGELYRDGLQRSRFLPAIALLERELTRCWRSTAASITVCAGCSAVRSTSTATPPTAARSCRRCSMNWPASTARPSRAAHFRPQAARVAPPRRCGLVQLRHFVRGGAQPERLCGYRT